MLVLFLALAWATRDALAELPFLRKQQAEAGRLASNGSTHVDLRPWQTAHGLAGLATTGRREENSQGRLSASRTTKSTSLRVGAALRQPGAGLAHWRGASHLAACRELQQVVNDDKALVQSLTERRLPTRRPGQTATRTTWKLPRRSLHSTSDLLADAQQDLARAGGDEPSRVQAELAAREVEMKDYDAKAAQNGQVVAIAAKGKAPLAGRVNAWFDQRTRYELVQQALRQAQADIVTLTAQHTDLHKPAQSRLLLPASGLDQSGRLAGLKRRSALSQLLAICNDRSQSQQQLAGIYSKWSAQILLQHRIVLHLLLQSSAVIVCILICVIFLDALARHLIDRAKLDQGRVKTLHIIFKLGIQFLGALIILFVIFGAPSEMPTILGLTTAGLTLVLQDFHHCVLWLVCVDG